MQARYRRDIGEIQGLRRRRAHLLLLPAQRLLRVPGHGRLRPPRLLQLRLQRRSSLAGGRDLRAEIALAQLERRVSNWDQG